MSPAPLSFCKRPSGYRPAAANHLRGRVCIGDLQEDFWSGIDIWNRDRYEHSWREAARLLVHKRQPVMFYTDVKARASSGYHAVPHGRAALLFDLIVRGAPRPVSQVLYRQQLLRERHEVSCWTVPITAFEPLAVLEQIRSSTPIVIPAKAGIHMHQRSRSTPNRGAYGSPPARG